MTIDQTTPPTVPSTAAPATAAPPTAAPEESEVLAFAARVLGDGTAAVTTLMAALGDRLGLFRALVGGPATAGDLAARAGIAPRYAEEWLAAMAARLIAWRL